jgi:hypothetical protein
MILIIAMATGVAGLVLPAGTAAAVSPVDGSIPREEIIARAK